MRSTPLFVFLAVLFVFCSAELPRVVFISPFGLDSPGGGSSTNPFRTLSYALPRVARNGTVNVMRGTYTGSKNVNIGLGNVHVRAYPPGENPAQFLFDGQNHSSAQWQVSYSGSSTTNITGIHFRNFYASSAAILSKGSSLGINNCLFEMSSAGVRLSTSGTMSVWINGTTFKTDSALYISNYYASVQMYTVTAELTFSTFDNASVSTLLYGLLGVDLTVNFATFVGYSASITSQLNTYSTSYRPSMIVSINNTDFSHNQHALSVTSKDASGYLARIFDSSFYNVTGGAIAANATSAVIVVSSSKFQRCGSNTVDGGALYVNNFASINVRDSKFSYNNGRNGGALYCGSAGTLNVQDCEFDYNTGVDQGVAYCASGCSVIAANNEEFHNYASMHTAPCEGL